MDIATALALLGSKGLIERVLGPTASYLGDELKEWTERRLQNAGRIFTKADKKLGTRVNEPGAVPPRVLSLILQDASFYEDELAAEYFGGVLASSRTSVGRDDRAATILTLLTRLSTYQLRTHYLIYAGLQQGADREKLSIAEPVVAVTDADYVALLELNHDEQQNFQALKEHALEGLSRDSLIGGVDQNEVVSITLRTRAGPGSVIQPTAFGIQVFLWAHGFPNGTVADFFSAAPGSLDAEPSLRLQAGILLKPNVIQVMPVGEGKYGQG